MAPSGLTTRRTPTVDCRVRAPRLRRSSPTQTRRAPSHREAQDHPRRLSSGSGSRRRRGQPGSGSGEASAARARERIRSGASAGTALARARAQGGADEPRGASTVCSKRRRRSDGGRPRNAHRDRTASPTARRASVGSSRRSSTSDMERRRDAAPRRRPPARRAGARGARPGPPSRPVAARRRPRRPPRRRPPAPTASATLPAARGGAGSQRVRRGDRRVRAGHVRGGGARVLRALARGVDDRRRGWRRAAATGRARRLAVDPAAIQQLAAQLAAAQQQGRGSLGLRASALRKMQARDPPSGRDQAATAGTRRSEQTSDRPRRAKIPYRMCRHSSRARRATLFECEGARRAAPARRRARATRRRGKIKSKSRASRTAIGAYQ